MTADPILHADNYTSDQGHFQHWRATDRRYYWSAVFEPIVGSPMVKCVMDDFGNLVRVSEVV